VWEDKQPMHPNRSHPAIRTFVPNRRLKWDIAISIGIERARSLRWSVLASRIFFQPSSPAGSYSNAFDGMQAMTVVTACLVSNA
jgi:hypothetical protein